MILIVLGREWIFWPFPCVGQMWELLPSLTSIHRKSTAAKALLHAPCAHEGWTALAWGKVDFSDKTSQGGRKRSSLSLQPSWSCADPFVQLETLTRQDCIVVSLTMMGRGRGHLSSHRTISPHVNLSSALSPSGIYKHFDGFNDDESPTSSRPPSLNCSV